MKKILLTLFACAALSTGSFAQKANVNSILSDIEKSNEDIEHPKKGAKYSTWITRGNRFNEAATANSSSIFTGMSEAQVLLIIGKPGKEGEYDMETISGVEYKKFVYPTVNLYLADAKLAFWEPTKEVYPGALEVAAESYLKALELSPKAESKAVEGLTTTINNYVSSANNMYTMNKFAEAAVGFIAAAELASLPSVNLPDANSYKYYGAVASVQGDNFKDSAPLFAELIADGFLEDGDVYYYAGFANEQLKNKEAAEAAYVAGVNAYPANQKIMNQLINFFITSGDDPAKVIPYIKKAQIADPKNVIMIFVEGIAYQNMKDYAKSHAAYDRAKVLDPKFFDTYYNDGLAYLSEADSKVQELNKIDMTNRKAYDEMLDVIIVLLESSIVQFTTAHELAPENKSVVELLKNSYFRLRDTDPKYLKLYNKFNDILKTM